jgi:hypothetical protein
LQRLRGLLRGADRPRDVHVRQQLLRELLRQLPPAAAAA